LLTACDPSDTDLATLEAEPSVNTELVIEDGSIEVLTYNVAGLPALISGSEPETTHLLIGPRLNDYQLVLVQEDFCYHDLLAPDDDTGANHPYQSDPAFDPPCVDSDSIGDGLNTFSDIPFTGFDRVPWAFCSGELDCKNDCLTPKGFTYARHQLVDGDPDAVVDVYNIHTDSGSCRTDFEARGRQIEQLIDAIKERSAGRAVIVAGDTNLRVTRLGDPQILEVLLDTAALRDACRELPSRCGVELLDRIMVRSAPNLILEVVDYDVPDEDFQDDNGEDLSDHKPVFALIAWELL
jgi:hypothetical protein